MIVMLIDDSSMHESDSICGLPAAIIDGVDGRSGEDNPVMRTVGDLWFGPNDPAAGVLSALDRIVVYPEDIYIAIATPRQLCENSFVHDLACMSRSKHGGVEAAVLCVDVCWELTPDVHLPSSTTAKPMCQRHDSPGCVCGALWISFLHDEYPWLRQNLCAISSKSEGRRLMRAGGTLPVPGFDKSPGSNEADIGFDSFIDWLLVRHVRFEAERCGTGTGRSVATSDGAADSRGAQI